jgi:hypothetical protein
MAMRRIPEYWKRLPQKGRRWYIMHQAECRGLGSFFNSMRFFLMANWLCKATIRAARAAREEKKAYESPLVRIHVA